MNWGLARSAASWLVLPSKIAKVFLILIGIFIAVLLYLGASDIIGINFGALWNAVGGWLGGARAAASWLIGLIVLIPFVGSFAVGFFLGFKLG
jgi:uncharacterized membrane protein (Fun14 family)